jgi:mRNA-degrading endonuclease RelE of RelBE toxin-antitoxin system
MASVVYTAAAARQFEALPLPIKQRVEKIVVRLAGWPAFSGAKPLRGELAGQYRVRTGDYPVQFRVGGSGQLSIVTIVKIGHRDGFYEE